MTEALVEGIYLHFPVPQTPEEIGITQFWYDLFRINMGDVESGIPASTQSPLAQKQNQHAPLSPPAPSPSSLASPSTEEPVGPKTSSQDGTKKSKKKKKKK